MVYLLNGTPLLARAQCLRDCICSRRVSTQSLSGAVVPASDLPCNEHSLPRFHYSHAVFVSAESRYSFSAMIWTAGLVFRIQWDGQIAVPDHREEAAFTAEAFPIVVFVFVSRISPFLTPFSQQYEFLQGKHDARHNFHSSTS